MASEFYILVIDKNLDDQIWLVTASASLPEPLMALPSHHDQIVMKLPIALYPGNDVAERDIRNTHSNQMEPATIFRVHHV